MTDAPSAAFDAAVDAACVHGFRSIADCGRRGPDPPSQLTRFVLFAEGGPNRRVVTIRRRAFEERAADRLRRVVEEHERVTGQLWPVLDEWSSRRSRQPRAATPRRRPRLLLRDGAGSPRLRGEALPEDGNWDLAGNTLGFFMRGAIESPDFIPKAGLGDFEANVANRTADSSRPVSAT